MKPIRSKTPTVGGATPTVKITNARGLDQGPTTFRVGLITLSSDHLMEREFTQILSDPALSFHATRIQSINPITIENLRTMAPLIEEGAKVLPSTLGSVGYYCTSGTIAIGDDVIRARIGSVLPDVPVATPIGGAIVGMRRLGLRRISLITPYTDSVNQAVRAYLENAGFVVLSIASFCLESDLEMYRLPPAAIKEAIVEHTDPNADGTFVSCTAIRAIETLQEAEQELEKPVVSAGQAFFWQLLREAKYTKAINGYGRLLQI